MEKDFKRVKIKKKSRFSFIWLIPLVAALIGCYLVYDYYMNRGLPITIIFSSGEGLEADKTLIRFEGVEVGKVTSIELIRGKKNVKVSATLDKSAASLARQGTIFWVVKPQLSAARISGLETMLTGVYISIRPGKEGGNKKKNFVGLDKPPPGDPNRPGLHIILRANELASLTSGSPVLYRQIEVGQVEEHELAEDNKGVDVNLHIFEEYAGLVRTTSRFWNAGGVTVTGSLSGLKVRTESLSALLAGGVAFDNPPGDYGEPCENNAVFDLYEDRESASAEVVQEKEEVLAPGIPITIKFKTAEGIESGITVVKYKGITVGKVTEISVAEDLSGVILSVQLVEKAKGGAKEGARFWVVKPGFGAEGLSGLDTIISGRYIEARPGHGPPKSDFIGLDEPPLSDPDEPGLHIVLKAPELGSLSPGSPVLHRQVEVGVVEGHELSENGDSVLIHLHISKKFARLVKEQTRFWNASGLDVQASLSGLKLRTESLESLLAGGVAFETPAAPDSKPAGNGAVFPLYADAESAREHGMPLTITFKTGEGLDSGTLLKYQGMTVGRVKEVMFNKEMTGVIVSALLDESARGLAREGSFFWVVRPKVGLGGISGLGTLVSGQYIQVRPGSGRIQTAFQGLEEPLMSDPATETFDIILHSERLGSLGAGKPVYYRSVQVGKITGYELADTADHVNIHVGIEERYAPLIRENTRFWNVSGIGMNFSILSGAKVKTESMKAILAGGVAFATPDNKKMGKPVSEGSVFKLYDEPKDKWLKWQPEIKLSEN